MSCGRVSCSAVVPPIPAPVPVQARHHAEKLASTAHNSRTRTPCHLPGGASHPPCDANGPITSRVSNAAQIPVCSSPPCSASVLARSAYGNDGRTCQLVSCPNATASAPLASWRMSANPSQHCLHHHHHPNSTRHSPQPPGRRPPRTSPSGRR